MADTIKDFLVSIGWQVNQSEADKFVNVIERATLRAKILGDVIEDMARKAWDAITSVASAFDRLYFSSQRTGAAVSTIRDFGYAVKQLGGSAESAQASLEAMGQKLRENPGNMHFLNMLGFGLNKVTGQLEVQRDLLAKFQSMPMPQAELLRGMVGEDERTFLAMRDPNFLKNMEEAAEARKRFGFDPDKAAEDANAFMTTWRRVSNDLGAIADDLFTKLMKALDGPFQEFQKFIEANGPEIRKDIDLITQAFNRMADGWVKSFEKILNNPDSMHRFQDGMHHLAEDISWLADSMTKFVDALRWVADKGGAAMRFVGRLTGGDSYEGEYDDIAKSNAARTPTSPSKTENGGSGGLSGWWRRTAPTWLGGDPAGGGAAAGGGEAAPASGAAGDRARWLAGKFKSRFGLTDEQAAGAIGWMLYESGGKLDPAAVGPNGDTGIAQWVGSRKQGLLGRGPLTLQSNWDQIEHEFTHVPMYQNAMKRIQAAKSRDEALYAFGEGYEGAGGTPLGMAEEYRRHRPWGDKAAKMLADPGTAPTAAGDGKFPEWMDAASRAKLGQVNAELAQNLIDAARKSGVRFSVTQGLRSQAEADANARSGRGVNDSQHLYGAAVDLHVEGGAGAYKRLGDAFEAIGRERGQAARWLGNVPGRWSRDIVHFDQGIGYGQAHERDPFAAMVARHAPPAGFGSAAAAEVPDWAKAAPRAGAASPFGGLDPHAFDKPLGGDSGGGDTNIHAPITNNFHIDGANDPSIVAHMVAANQKRANDDLTRNLIGATN